MDKLSKLVFLCVFVSGFLLTVLCAPDPQNKCEDCRIEHKQTLFCNSDFAFKATILSVISDDYFIRKFLVAVDEVFKGQEYIYDTAIEIQTPVGIHLCSKNVDVDAEYLITGHLYGGELEFVFCDWVDKWATGVTEFQKEALRNGYYASTCDAKNCNVDGTKSAHPKKDDSFFSKYECYFNPVYAHMKKFEDCEMDKGICVEEDDKCVWTSPGSESYQTCFDLRHKSEELKEAEEGGAFAITSLRDCKLLYKGKQNRKYKLCVKKVWKAKQNLQVREMGDVLRRMTELEEIEEEEKEIDAIIEREEQTLIQNDENKEEQIVETEAQMEDDEGAEELLKLFKEKQNVEETQETRADDVPHEVELLEELERILKSKS